MKFIFNSLRSNQWRLVRYILAFIVIAFCVRGTLLGEFLVCDFTNPGSSDASVTCRTPVLTDSGVLAMLVLVVALIWAEISEVGLFGLSVKQKLLGVESIAKNANKRSMDSETRIAALATRVDVISSSFSASAATSQTSIHLRAGDWGDISQGTVKESGFESYKNQMDSASSGKSDAELRISILKAWEDIRENILTTLPTPALTVENKDYWPDEDGMVRDYLKTKYSAQIDVIRAVRNSVAHAKDIPRDDLSAALSLANVLLSENPDRLLSTSPNPEGFFS
ncbi:hypothetical protein [Mycetocola lacteus]|uniref:hypothetical protein n=1 Tax=Mycetocola lacteus TaxID=76637 RepID=UPI0011C3ADAC|nr:hypothetical protein [Mycetocola lacteus]